MSTRFSGGWSWSGATSPSLLDYLATCLHIDKTPSTQGHVVPVQAIAAPCSQSGLRWGPTHGAVCKGDAWKRCGSARRKHGDTNHTGEGGDSHEGGDPDRTSEAMTLFPTGIPVGSAITVSYSFRSPSPGLSEGKRRWGGTARRGSGDRSEEGGRHSAGPPVFARTSSSRSAFAAAPNPLPGP